MQATAIRIDHSEACWNPLIASQRGSKTHAVAKAQPAFKIQESSKTESILG